MPTEKECLEMAMNLATDYKPEKVISKEESDEGFLLFEGDVLPEEFTFYTKDILELIRFCQGKQ